MSEFAGFTLPDGAWLPPELMYLLPHIKTLGELKVIIATIYNAMQVGGAEPMTVTDLENLTGLSHQAVVDATKACVSGQLPTLDRHQVGRSFVYTPKMSVKKVDRRSVNKVDREVYPVDPTVNKVDRSASELVSQSDISLSELEKDNSLTDLAAQRSKLLTELRAAGVYLKTAQGLVQNFDEARIRRQMEHYAYALRMNLAGGPGWLVLAIKENWPEPLGYVEDKELAEQVSNLAQPGQVQQVEPVVKPAPAESQEAQQLWQMTLGELSLQMNKTTFDARVKPVILVSYDHECNEFVAAVEIPHVKDWLEHKLLSSFERSLRGITGRPVALAFVTYAEWGGAKE